MSTASPTIVLNIVSVSYSGSTWANTVAGSHPDAFSIGEMDRIVRMHKASCRMHGEACPIWSQFDTQSEENPYLQIARIAGKRILVVNNIRYLLPQQQDSNLVRKYLFLVRDGRAVAASAMRKYPDHTIWKAARFWATTIRKKQKFIRKQNPADVLRVYYEEFVQDIDGHARRICELLGVEYDPAMAEYWKKDHCFVGGNSGAQTVLTQAGAAHGLHADGTPSDRKPVGPDKEFYGKVDPAHFVDERWKDELTDGQLRIFGLAAGRMNRSLGYPASLDRNGPIRGGIVAAT